MATFSNFRCFALLIAVSASLAAFAQGEKQKDDPLSKKDTRVEPTSWGNVYGRIYDAKTGTPILGATVSIETDEGFQQKGRSVATTDELGGYHAQCILGRISHNFDVGRALLTSGIGMLFGGATNTTKRIDAARVNLHIEAQGFKPFEGVVTARRKDAGAFRIDLEPVLLVADGSEGVSVAAAGWTAVRIVNAGANPSVAHKGDTVKLITTVRAFGKNPSKNIELAALSRLWRGERRMDLAKVQPDPNNIRFETEYKVSGKEKNSAEIVYFYIRRSVLDYNTQRSAIRAVIQFASNTGQEEAAKDRLSAIDLLISGKAADATSLLKKLVLVPNPNPCDLELLAQASDRCSDYETSAGAWEKMAVDKDVDIATGITQRARAQYLAKKYDATIDTVETPLRLYKPKEWPNKIDAKAIGYLGLAYTKRGDLDKGHKLNEDLLNWPQSGLDPAVIEFRNNLRLAEVVKADADNPGSPAALADYGRALLDLGRYEEAVAKLKQAIDLDPNQPAIKRDLAWAALQMHGPEPKTDDLATAVAEARAGLNLEKGKQKSKDFFSWNQYAVLLFALAEQQRAAGAPEANATSDEAISAFREALTLGRVGARTNAGAYNFQLGYISGSEVAISGFAYPQANASFVLLDSLKKLRKDPNNYLALFNQASALLDLGQTTLAEQSITKLSALRPDFVEGIYLASLIQARQGDVAKAEESLQKVLTLNPLHPRANLLLAEFYAKDGDVAASAEHLASHAKHYEETLSGQ